MGAPSAGKRDADGHETAATGLTFRGGLSVLSAGTASGMLLGGLIGALLPPHGALSALQSAALGAVPGLGWGISLIPLTVSLSANRPDGMRAGLTRGVPRSAILFLVALAAFGTAVSVPLAALPPILRRIEVPEVAAFVAVAVVLGSLVATSLIAALAFKLRKFMADIAGSSVRLRFLLRILGGACVLLLLAVGSDVALEKDGTRFPFPLPLSSLQTASHAWDVGGAIVVMLTPAVAVPFAWVTLRWRALAPSFLLVAAGALTALAASDDVAPLLYVSGPRAWAIRAAQRVFDRDRDGYAVYFGGGDCDDRDPRVHPLAAEIAGNGRDEDCEDGDLVLSGLAALELPDPMTPDVRAALESRVPRDLDVVLLTVDALRADLGFCGNPHPVSPNLDRLAERSVVFSRAYAPATYTARSLGSVMTGRFAEELDRTGGTRQRFAQSNTFLAERLHQAGWSTVHVPGSELLRPQGGLTQGFSRVLEDVLPAQVWAFGVLDDRIADRTLELVRWPEGTTDRYFLWAHFIDPHEGYVEHPEFGDWGHGETARYWQEVAWTDRQVGRILDAIERLPEQRRNRTLVIVTADHGESLGEHDARSHGSGLWEVQLRVPFLVWGPGLAPHRVDTPRSLVDLVPTILDLLRIPRPAEGAHDALSGRSLVPDLLGFAPQKRLVYAELPSDSNARADCFALIDGPWKLSQRGPHLVSLFDLLSDPHELNDLARERPDELTRMRQMLKLFRSRLRTTPATTAPHQEW